MGYLNNKLGYRKDTLSIRSKIKHGNIALLEPDGMVKNQLPGFENVDITIMGSPRMGASFVDYRAMINPKGKTTMPFGETGVQVFLYVIEGELDVRSGGKTHTLKTGAYIYVPAQDQLEFVNNSEKQTHVFMYKKYYDSVNGHYETYQVVGHRDALEWIDYEGMKDVRICNFLPSEIAFDMNIHILDFAPGASHGYIETHVQEHGALVLTGQGMYNLDNEWMPVEEGDYIFMGPYSLQGAYGVGRETHLSYIYSKDCNRDIILRGEL